MKEVLTPKGLPNAKEHPVGIVIDCEKVNVKEFQILTPDQDKNDPS